MAEQPKMHLVVGGFRRVPKRRLHLLVAVVSCWLLLDDVDCYWLLAFVCSLLLDVGCSCLLIVDLGCRSLLLVVSGCWLVG